MASNRSIARMQHILPLGQPNSKAASEFLFAYNSANMIGANRISMQKTIEEQVHKIKNQLKT